MAGCSAHPFPSSGLLRANIVCRIETGDRKHSTAVVEIKSAINLTRVAIDVHTVEAHWVLCSTCFAYRVSLADADIFTLVLAQPGFDVCVLLQDR